MQVAADYRHKNGLNVLDLLDQNFLPKTDGEFQAIGELGMPLADDFHLLLTLLEPLNGLIVGVKYQWNCGSIEDHHRILNRKRIASQPLTLPFQLHSLIDHILQEVIIFRLDL